MKRFHLSVEYVVMVEREVLKHSFKIFPMVLDENCVKWLYLETTGQCMKNSQHNKIKIKW